MKIEGSFDNVTSLPGATQILLAVQYSPSEQVSAQVAGDWQVRGPPVINSLQDVKLGTAEQSDVTPQDTIRIY